MAIADTVKTLIPQLAIEGVTDMVLASYVLTSLETFSTIFPRIKGEIIDIASSNALYVFTLPTSWEDRFSAIMKLEYPLSQRPPKYLDMDVYGIHLDTVTGIDQLMFYDDLPVSDVGIIYTVRWTETTLSEADAFSCALLTAALVCDRLAAKYASSTSSDFGADVINWSTKTREYTNVKNNFLHLFALRTNVDTRKIQPSAALEYTNTYSSTTVSGLFRDITEDK